MADSVQTKTSPNDPISSLNPTQVKNIKTIIGVGKALGVTSNGIVTALAVANDESTFLNYGNVNVPGSENGSEAMGQDHDSIGLFQQRAGDYGWMPQGDLKTGMNTVHQAAAFYGGTPNASAPGLLQQQGWQQANPGALAQQIQQSGTPTAYYPLVQFAQQLLKAYGNTPPVSLPFKPRAVGPLYVEHTVASIRAAAPAPAAVYATPVPVENSQGAVPKPSAAPHMMPAAAVQPGPTQKATASPTPPPAPPATASANAGKGGGPDKIA